MIRTVIKSWSGMVMVFDSKGEQMPQYQSRYEAVKGCILENAPPDGIFSQISGDELEGSLFQRSH